MRWRAKLRSWVRTVFRQAQMENEMSAESQFHIETYAEDLMRKGFSPQEARRRSRLEFGGLEKMKQECREASGARLIDALSQDLRSAVRALLKKPGFAALSVLTLGLGVGASTSIFSVVENVLLEPFPYPDAKRFVTVQIHDADKSQGAFRAEYSGPEFIEYVQRNRVFDRVIANASRDVLYRRTAGVELFHGIVVTPNTFEFFGVPPLRGRAFMPADYEPAAAPVFVLRYKTWITSFGGDPAVLNESFVLNGVRRTLVGIMPPRFAWGDGDVWIPEKPSISDTPSTGEPSVNWYLVGHLKPGVSLEKAQADLTVVAHEAAKVFPQKYPSHFRVDAVSFTDMVVGRFRSTLYVTLAAAGLLLLIACTNVANLILAHAINREREFAIRAALGATRLVLFRQLLVESLFLAMISAALGMVFALAGLKWIVSLIPPNTIAAETAIQLNAPVWLFAAGLAALTPLLFGLGPALKLVQSDLEKPLRSSGKGSLSSSAPLRSRNVLIASEVALSFILLFASGLLMKTFFSLRKANLGFDADRVLVTRLLLPIDRYKTSAQVVSFHQALLNRLRALPAVIGAAESNALPPDGGFPSDVDVAGRIHSETWTSLVQLCSEDYFSVLRLRLLAGRTFSEVEGTNGRKVAIINESFRKSYLEPGNVIGARVYLGVLEHLPARVQDPWFEVIGVVGDALNQGLQEPARPEIWVPYSLAGFGQGALLIRTTGDPNSVVSAVRRTVWSEDSGVPITATASLEDRLDSLWYAGPHFAFVLMSIFAAVGLILASGGVYGVTAYSVSRRTNEIGVRMSLGASRVDTLRWVFSSAMRVITLGVCSGLVFSVMLSRLIAGQLWDVSPNDPATITGVGALLLFVGAISCLIPALRATRIDPVVALRHE